MLLRSIRSTQCLKKLISSKFAFKYAYEHQRIIRKCSNTPVREFLDVPIKENEFWYKMLCSDKRYCNHLAFLDYLNETDPTVDVNDILKSSFSIKSGYVLMKDLKSILQSSEHSDAIRSPSVTELTKELTSKLKELNDEQLINLLKVLTLWPNKNSDQRFFNLCKAIDGEALERGFSWGYSTILLVMDHFYRLRVVRYSDFIWQNMKRIWRNPVKLSPTQVVHAMFLVNANRKWHQAVDVKQVESVLLEYAYDLSVEEAGLLALAFFKTQTPAHDLNLVNILYDKLENRLDDPARPLDSMILTAYLKFFRLSTIFTLRHRVQRLLAKLVDLVERISLTACTHTALLGTRLLVRNTEVLEKVAERFCREMSSARLKDLERLTFALELLNYTPKTEKNIFEAVMEELHKRDDEISSFPKVFLCTLHYLSLIGYYDHELINKGLSIDFLRKAFHEVHPHAIPVDILQLSSGVQLECPDYNGSCLGDLLVTQMSEIHTRILPSGKTNSERLILSVVNVLEKILGGPQFVRLTYVLPYSSHADVIFCLKDQKPVEIPNSTLPKHYMPIQKPPDIGQWYVIYRLGVGVVIAETVEPTGTLAAKLRHMKILGYKPLAVNEFEWNKLDVDKMKYLQTLIENAK